MDTLNVVLSKVDTCNSCKLALPNLEYHIIYKLLQGIIKLLSPTHSEAPSLVWLEAQLAPPGHIQDQGSQIHILVI